MFTHWWTGTQSGIVRILQMRKPLLNRKRNDLLTGCLLAMLLFRAYVPVGFMPASGTPLLLELCFAAAPMPMSIPMPGHHHHSGTHTHFENCPFGSVSASGPAPHLSAVNALPPINLESAPTMELLPVGVQLISRNLADLLPSAERALIGCPYTFR